MVIMGLDKPHKRITREELCLYAVTDRRWLRTGETLESVIEELIKGGVSCVQLREKRGTVKDSGYDAESLIDEAVRIKRVCDSYHVPFIVNDRPEIAKEIKASGVHLGCADMEIAKAREMLGEAYLIGASVHSVNEALSAQASGADYLGCGAVFGSESKEDASALSINELAVICRAVDIPVVAIGGITLENVSMLRDTGIAGIAAISALFAAEDKKKAARGMRLAIQNERKTAQTAR